MTLYSVSKNLLEIVIVVVDGYKSLADFTLKFVRVIVMLRLFIL